MATRIVSHHSAKQRVVTLHTGEKEMRGVNRYIAAAGVKSQRTRTKSEYKEGKYRNFNYEGWNFNSGNNLFTTDTK